MPGTIDTEGPSVSLSFANNFWGKDDAGVSPLLERMHNAKVTGDELKAFYTARAQIEDDYARKLLNLARKPLGSSESGTLRMSLNVIRGEVESMGKAHQHVAGQMKSELEEPLSAFTGGIKERRKIVQNGIEKLLKAKTQQTTAVNKTRDRYEQDCLKIKGYLAQGHMVMGQEERKNKSKLEKTQIQLSATSNEYEAAVKVLEETTARWNREWKAACDRFQDLEEERIDFTKNSLWNFANIASTVCVSDDAACEKIRLSLEDCHVEKDISRFIKDQGTGQEIPDAPKFINFCRGDINDTASDTSNEGAYSVAQFQRAINPAFRTSSPQPSTMTSHHDTDTDLSRSLRHDRHPSISQEQQSPETLRSSQNRTQQQPVVDYSDLPTVPHNEYPPEGMTQFCRIGPPSDRSSVPSPTRTDHDDRSEYSNPTSHSSLDPTSGHQSPAKQFIEAQGSDPTAVAKKKSGFFQHHSPFHRRSKQDIQKEMIDPTTPSTRDAWHSNQGTSFSTGRHSKNVGFGNGDNNESTATADPRANFQLNVGNNVFDIASPDGHHSPQLPRTANTSADFDPVVQALADLKGVGSQSSARSSADPYHGSSTTAPAVSFGSESSARRPSTDRYNHAQPRHPMYENRPMSSLGAPQPAFTSRQMQQTTAEYVHQKRDIFGTSAHADSERRSQSVMSGRPAMREGRMNDVPRAVSPAPLRSPGPVSHDGRHDRTMVPRGHSPMSHTMTHPGGRIDGHLRTQSSSPIKVGGNRPAYGDNQVVRVHSPRSRIVQAPNGRDPRGSFNDGVSARPTSQLYGDGPYAAANDRSNPSSDQTHAVAGRERAKSSSAPRKVTRDGTPILHFSRALYMYQAAIPEELSFEKGDVLAVLRHQDDGWWEAEIAGAHGRTGLVPSNYLKPC